MCLCENYEITNEIISLLSTSKWVNRLQRIYAFCQPIYNVAFKGYHLPPNPLQTRFTFSVAVNKIHNHLKLQHKIQSRRIKSQPLWVRRQNTRSCYLRRLSSIVKIPDFKKRWTVFRLMQFLKWIFTALPKQHWKSSIGELIKAFSMKRKCAASKKVRRAVLTSVTFTWLST